MAAAMGRLRRPVPCTTSIWYKNCSYRPPCLARVSDDWLGILFPSLTLLFEGYEDHSTQHGEYLIEYALLRYPAVGPLTILQMQQAYPPDAAGIAPSTVRSRKPLHRSYQPTWNLRICLIADCSARVMFGHRCRAVIDFLALVAAATISRSIVRMCRSNSGDRNWFPFHVRFTSAHWKNSDTYVLQNSVDMERCLGVHCWFPNSRRIAFLRLHFFLLT